MSYLFQIYNHLGHHDPGIFAAFKKCFYPVIAESTYWLLLGGLNILGFWHVYANEIIYYLLSFYVLCVVDVCTSKGNYFVI